MSIQKEIQNKYTELSKQEKAVANYILTNSESIQNMNIVTLSQLTYTSTATITRFVKKIGCDNFMDMKVKLVSHVPLDEMKNRENDKTDLLDYYIHVIRRTEEITEKESLEKIVQMIMDADRIVVYGVGSSGLTAQEFAQRLIRMGLTASATTDSHMMLINSTVIKKGVLVLGISASGETKEVVASARVAIENGATSAAITSFPHSTLGQMVDVQLNAYSSMFIDDKRFINSQFSIMYQIDTISTMLLEREHFDEKMSKTIKAITKK